VTFRNRTRAQLALIAAFALPAVAAVVLAAAWLTVRGPEARLRDFLRFERSWRQTVRRIANLPTYLEAGLKSAGLVRYSTARFEVERGVVLTLDPTDHIARAMLSGGWEETEWNWIRPSLSKGGTFVDVGAHIGTYSLRAAKAVGNNGRVVAIEPNPVTAAALRDNIAASGWHNIQVQEIACGDRNGTVTLFAGHAENTGTASLAERNARRGGPLEASFDVPLSPLDNILERLSLARLDVIKIDTEGAETMVIRGAVNTLRKFSPVILVETIDGQLRNMNSSLPELENVLSSLGYEKRKSDGYNALWRPVARNTAASRR
jgi:FkbM family methyltransferase